ncbi:B12-binding domain-containing protein [Bacillus coahuilensis]
MEHVKELDLHPVELFEDIIRPTMYQVGELWEKIKSQSLKSIWLRHQWIM